MVDTVPLPCTGGGGGTVGTIGEGLMRERHVSSMSTRLRLGYGSFPTASLELGREGGSSGRVVCVGT